MTEQHSHTELFPTIPANSNPDTENIVFGKIKLTPSARPDRHTGDSTPISGFTPAYTHRDLVAEDRETVDIFASTVRADRDYPALHLAPPVGRLNDPNGLVYDGTYYHAFYQYSPLHPERIVYWRHAKSEDLTHWEDAGTALIPNTRYDSHGCYSGAGVRVDGGFEFFYTGNVRDMDGGRDANQLVALAGADAHPTRALPPLIEGPAPGYTAHFRDPQVFYRNGCWWIIIGAQRQNKTGTVVAYTSDDRRNWSWRGEINITDPLLSNCYMHECPALIQLLDEATGMVRDVLIFSPQGLKPSGEKYQNIYQSGYVVGEFNPQTLRFEVHTPFQELDAGFEFYAPQPVYGTGYSALEDAPHPETILIGWLGNAEQDDHPSWAHRWVHMFTYPRQLHLVHGRLYQRPVPELDAALPLIPAAIDSDRGKVPELKDARTWRLRGRVKVGEEPATIRIKDSNGVALRIVLASDFAQVDRSGTRYTVGGTLRRRTLANSSVREFEVLVDASATELFVGGEGASGYEQVFSSRTYFWGRKRRVRITGGEVLELEYARI